MRMMKFLVQDCPVEMLLCHIPLIVHYDQYCCKQIKLVQHTYSCLFGTFLFNTCREREKEALTNPSSSVWTLLHPENAKFHNPLFNDAAKEVSLAIRIFPPCCHVLPFVYCFLPIPF